MLEVSADAETHAAQSEEIDDDACHLTCCVNEQFRFAFCGVDLSDAQTVEEGLVEDCPTCVTLNSHLNACYVTCPLLAFDVARVV